MKQATIIKDLSEVLDHDELHMFYILLRDVKINVRCGKETGDTITTNIGTPQAACASAFLFTFYLAKSIQDHRITEQEYSYAIPKHQAEEYAAEHLKDHNYITEIQNKIPAKLKE